MNQTKYEIMGVVGLGVLDAGGIFSIVGRLVDRDVHGVFLLFLQTVDALVQ